MNEELDKAWQEKLTAYARHLPDDKLPSPLLEERTVRALRKRDLLRRKRALPTTWLVGSVAASLALFATGVVVGQYLGTRSTASAMAQVQGRPDAAAATAQVQQTGTAYVEALSRLVTASRQGQNGPVNGQARDVALSALHEAANEVVRLAPNDPVAAKILQGIEQERAQNQPRNGRTERQIVWF